MPEQFKIGDYVTFKGTIDDFESGLPKRYIGQIARVIKHNQHFRDIYDIEFFDHQRWCVEREQIKLLPKEKMEEE